MMGEIYRKGTHTTVASAEALVTVPLLICAIGPVGVYGDGLVSICTRAVFAQTVAETDIARR